MCGINGFFSFSDKKIDNSKQFLGNMNDLLAHRGPDDAGIWVNEERGVYLGHRRLSIIDLSNHGHQPMEGIQGNSLVFNGEVYNYQSIKAQLSNKPYQSNSDTEVVLRSLEEKGKNAVDLFNGMFAIAYWDNCEDRLTLYRDRLGIKPLYYCSVGGIFAFSSEIRSLLSLPWISAELDESSLYEFLTYNNLRPTDTMFKGIHKLEPGYRLQVNRRGVITKEQYWDIEYSNLADQTEEELASYLLSDFDRSVKLRVVSDVPVGAFLSGGVDSSAVVASMTAHTDNINTFSIGFEDQPDYDELQYAATIAKQFKTNHFEKIITKEDLTEFLPTMVDIFDEPLADATSIPIYFISKLARENKTPVILTGDGADELFCGYRKWMQYSKVYPFYRMAERMPGFAKRALSSVTNKLNQDAITTEMLTRLSRNQELFWGGAGAFKENEKQSILNTAYLNNKETEYSAYKRIQSLREDFLSHDMQGRESSDVDWMCYLGMKNIVPDYYLHRADRLGMANSIELRVPFMDHEFVNFGLSVPGSYKTKNKIPKYILKKAMEKRLDKSILYRKKQGFCVPLKEWGRDVMVSDLLDNPVFNEVSGLFDAEQIKYKVQAYAKGQYNNDFAIWNLYFLNAWFKRWLT